MVDIGAEVAGYRLVELLGTGPFGRTYRADDPRGGQVALKLLKPSFLGRVDGASAFERLWASVSVHAQLAHPYLVRVKGPIREPTLQAFGQVAEYLPGHSLAQLKVGTDVRQGRDPRGLAALLECFEQLGDVLHWLHEQGMVHGNLKPNNVLVLPHQGEYHLKLLDLSWSAIGVAAVARGPTSFVSPEQYSGVIPTTASDQWAVGTMLERAFTGGRYRLPLGVLPAALVQAIQRATFEAPDERFASMGELTEALREIRIDLLHGAGQPISAPHASATLPAGSVPADLADPPLPPSPHPTTRRAAPLEPPWHRADAHGASDGGRGDEAASTGGEPSDAGQVGAALTSSAGMGSGQVGAEPVTTRQPLPTEAQAQPEASRGTRGPKRAPLPSSSAAVTDPWLGAKMAAVRRGPRPSSQPVVGLPAGALNPGSRTLDGPSPEEDDDEPFAASPMRRYDIGDVLGEGPEELIDGPEGPDHAFGPDDPTAAGARPGSGPAAPMIVSSQTRADLEEPPAPPSRRRQLPPASDTVVDPIGSSARFSDEPKLPSRLEPSVDSGPLVVPRGLREDLPLHAGPAERAPSPIRSPDPGIAPPPRPPLESAAAPPPRPPLEPAPAPKWAPRIAALLVIAAALGVGSWYVAGAPLGATFWPSEAPTESERVSGPTGEGAGAGAADAETPRPVEPAASPPIVTSPDPAEPSSAPVSVARAPAPEAPSEEPHSGSPASSAVPGEIRRPPPTAKPKSTPPPPPDNKAKAKAKVASSAAPAPRSASQVPPPAPAAPPSSRSTVDEAKSSPRPKLERRRNETAPGSVLARTADACDAGDAAACLKLGQARQVAGAVVASLAAFERACSLGHGAACLRAAGGYARRRQQADRSVALYVAACDAGLAEGCHRAALAGSGEAAEALEARACALGRETSCAAATN